MDVFAPRSAVSGRKFSLMAGMHADELEIDEPLVRRLVAEQFPEWADWPLRRVEPAGAVNAIFRLGDELSVRLARRKGATRPGGKELDWLPRLAPLLPLEIPIPVAQGRPNAKYPWFWDIVTWLTATRLRSSRSTPSRPLAIWRRSWRR